MRLIVLFTLVLLLAVPVQAERFLCSGQVGTAASRGAAKPSLSPTTGTRRVIVLFARFEGTAATEVPAWAASILDSERPGSFSHYWDTMSRGQLRLRGEVGPRVYVAPQPAIAYLSDDSTQAGQFGRFTQEILTQADADIDFSRFDDDGPDGVPNSGDDDGVVDAVFLVIPEVPSGFLVGAATGISGLGLDPAQRSRYVTQDRAASGGRVRILSAQGSIQLGRTPAEAVGAMCHEYGHVLGLPDLYDTGFLRRSGALPEEDSAGVGAWCLMGWGALGWHGTDGPNGLCAFSRMRLGWAQVTEPGREETTMALPEVGRAGQVYQIPVSKGEYYLLEYRQRSSTWYDRNIPAEGLLVWHVTLGQPSEDQPSPYQVDLECADGRWRDAGYPLGRQADPASGGNNLDFWAHDAAYAQVHAGNLGDATDPFDGVHFTAFTPQTNPAALGSDGQAGVHVEEISLAEGVARARIQTIPAAVEITSLSLPAPTLAAGVAMPITFDLANRGGLRLTELTARLTTVDPRLEIVNDEIPLADLEVGQETFGGTVGSQEPLNLRFRADLAAPDSAAAVLEILSQGEVLARREVRLRGVPSFAVTGVIRQEGRPAAGIDVEIDMGTTAAGIYFQTAAITDSSGTYLLRLPAGQYALVARWYPKNPAYNLRTMVGVLQDTEVDFALPRLCRVTGTVRDPQGQAVADLAIAVYSSDGLYLYRIYAAPDGTYALDLPSGDYILHTDYQTSGQYPDQALARIQARGDQVLDLTLQTGVELTIRTVDEQGDPVGLVSFTLTSEGLSPGAWASIFTMPDGTGTGRVAPGRYRVSMSGYVGSTPYVGVPPSAAEINGDTTLVVTLIRGLQLTGRLRDGEGNEIQIDRFASSTLYLYTVGGDLLLARWLPDAQFSLGVEAGTYQVLIDVGRLSEFPSQLVGPIEVRQDTVVDFVLRRGVTLQGTLTTADGGVAGPGSITLTPSEGSMVSEAGYTRPVDRYGEYSELHPPPGRYHVTVAFAEGATFPDQDLGEIEVEADGGRDFIVRTGFLIAGRVLDQDGSRLENGRLAFTALISGDLVKRVELQSSGLYSAILLPGRYQARYLPAGDSTLAASHLLGELDLAQNTLMDWQLGTGTPVLEEGNARPLVFALRQNYPNPFNGQTAIPYELPVRGSVELMVYNLVGQVVRRLVVDEQEAGPHVAAWDGRDQQGRPAASGVYLCRLTAGKQEQVRRLMLLR